MVYFTRAVFYKKCMTWACLTMHGPRFFSPYREAYLSLTLRFTLNTSSETVCVCLRILQAMPDAPT